jgi:phosphate-selective porin OprO/OprP
LVQALSARWRRHTLGALLIVTAVPALAQSTESNDVPIGDHTGGDIHVVDHTRRYFWPDLPVSKPPSPEKQARFFTIRPSLAMIGDWTGWEQNQTNLNQVGLQENQFQVRSARLNFFGSIGHGYKVGFQVGGEYKGFDTDPDQTWQLTDLSLTFPIGGRTKLTIGKMKETFSYEMVGDAANLPQFERVLNPFFVSRNTGARLTHVFGADKRATLAVGAYNDNWDPGSTTSRGWDITARATGLVWDDPANKRFLHLGFAYRRVASDGSLVYRGRAETNVGKNFVDTGKIDADSANHYGFEGLLNIGAFSLLGEYVVADVNTPVGDDPQLTGYYLTGSLVLTGETRPYDRNVGYARRVIPTGYWGAPELVMRYAHVDLTDQQVDGGSYDRLSFGLNWWATTRWKFGGLYGFTWLDRFGERGLATTFLARVQWVY